MKQLVRTSVAALDPRAGRIGTGLLVVLGLLVLVAVGAFWSMGIRNGAVERDEGVQAAWADVEAQLQRRFDLVPNLVATVKGAAAFEKETLTAVTEARASVGRVKLDLQGKGQSLLDDPAAMQRYLAAQNQLGSALQRLLVVSERYPELRATQSFADLQHQLEGTENRIAQARKDYNDAVRAYNAWIRRVPYAWFLSDEEFPRRVPFEASTGAESVPQVDFGAGG